MAVNGLFATIFILGVGGELNGPTIGGIFTIVGFSATGKHIRNIAPIMFGVLFASFTKRWTINSPSPMLALAHAVAAVEAVLDLHHLRLYLRCELEVGRGSSEKQGHSRAGVDLDPGRTWHTVAAGTAEASE